MSCTFAVFSLLGLVISALTKTVELFLSVSAHSSRASVRLLVCQKHKKGQALCVGCQVLASQLKGKVVSVWHETSTAILHTTCQENLHF